MPKNTSPSPFTIPMLTRLLVLSGLVMGSGAVMAQAGGIDAGALQQNLERQLPSPSPLALPEPTAPAPAPAQPAGQNEVRFEVKSFVLEGVNTIPEAKVQAVLKEWLGRPVNFDDLQKATDAIVSLYRASGFTVQAILPPQKIANGVVRILVTEAKLSSVFVDTPRGETRFNKDRAASYITYANPLGEPLNTKAIERALIILNETPGVMVSSQLEAGQNDGETAVRLQLTQPTNWYQGKVEANNFGSRSTGANQGVFAFTAINPSGIGDTVSVNAIVSDGSQYLQSAYSLPVARDGLRMGASATFLGYRNVSNYVSPNGGYGNAWTAGLSAAYPLVRKQGTNVNATLNYDIKNYTNKLISDFSVISAYTINNTTLGLSGNHYDSFGGGGISAGSVSVVMGNLNISSSSIGFDQPNPALRFGANTPANFTKMTFSGNRNQQLSSDGTTTAYIGINGQLASVDLNSAEQFYLGGPYGVRAYPVAQGGGSQGGIATAELRHQFPDRIQVSVFFDAGLVQQFKNPSAFLQGLTNAQNTYSLMGTGLGVKWDWQGWNLGATIAWKVGANPLFTQAGRQLDTDGTNINPRGWVTASYQF